MTEKELESMATLQIKQDYPPSEVYSTASEAPPAYKRRSNSVKVTKICAFTVIVSSFVIGSFILASTYLQVFGSCDHMQALESMLEKELMFEAMQKELPRAEPLVEKENVDDNLQLLKNEDTRKKENSDKQDAIDEKGSLISDNNQADNLQNNEYQIPLELDFNDLAAALLENNRKSRMNCVIERKRAVDFVDTSAQSMKSPFGVNLSIDPKKQRITGERISISCDNNDNEKRESNEFDEDIPPIFVAHQRPPIAFEPESLQTFLTHLAQRIDSFQSFQMPPQTPPEFMLAPHQMPQVQNEMKKSPIPQEMQEEILRESQIFPGYKSQFRRVPLGIALQSAGITVDDLINIQRMAEEHVTEEFRNLVKENNPTFENNNFVHENDHLSEGNHQRFPQRMTLSPPMQRERVDYGSNLSIPVKIPVPIIQSPEMINPKQDPANIEIERPHYVQPRSIENVKHTFLHREKRIKRCACNCNC